MTNIVYTAIFILIFLSSRRVEGNASVRYNGDKPLSGEALGPLEPLSSDTLVEHDSLSSDADIQFDHFMPFAHYLLKRQAPSNSTVQDSHDYYTSQYYPPGPMADSLWVNLSEVSGVIEDLAHNISDRYRFFAVHDLMFDFPFYGHIVNSVAITTAGFIYVGTFLHRFIHLTQYIAPLQADFNPGLNDTATVLVYSTEENFTIQWDKVHNHDHVSNGTFTFQMTLFKSGVIHFVYREIPLLVSEITEENHPVEVGLSDSFYVDVPIAGSGGPGILRTIYEYHRIVLDASDDLANSAYVITPLPNCIMASSCDECVSISGSSPFECRWCDSLNRCSDGIDRHRQEWFVSGCATSSKQQCEMTTTAETTTAVTITTSSSTSNPSTTGHGTTTVSQPNNEVMQQTGNQVNIGTVTGIIVVICLVVLLLIITGMLVSVLTYGYRNPTSRFGQLMIKYRPKARTLNKVSAAYNVESGNTRLT